MKALLATKGKVDIFITFIPHWGDSLGEKYPCHFFLSAEKDCKKGVREVYRSKRIIAGMAFVDRDFEKALRFLGINELADLVVRVRSIASGSPHSDILNLHFIPETA